MCLNRVKGVNYTVEGRFPFALFLRQVMFFRAARYRADEIWHFHYFLCAFFFSVEVFKMVYVNRLFYLSMLLLIIILDIKQDLLYLYSCKNVFLWSKQVHHKNQAAKKYFIWSFLFWFWVCSDFFDPLITCF